ncbi:LPS export ABC transporter permease LptF [Glaciecola sp. XM2]|jgi:lipopolysaccharide export system permease protein|uniref:LPS export ABC transporter permease LptF n=1 Tax=Glaciecola sp. XM2 TaxID=1914931 RepID=UPI001BDEBE08|nr:LPS export ABC transporter permease LptF [Glaciecola sp. XM2]MBT1452518.1 LPS export ABC transporter permease LptF [Glaciecola sp. XM2]
MLIFRYLLRETFKSQIAVFFILMTIFITLRFVRVLGDATDGNVPADLIVGFITLYSPVLASLVLPISLFLGVMLAHGRMYVESEMTVLRACGVSEWYVTRVTLFFSLVIAAITAVVTLYLAPLALEKEYQLKEDAAASSGIAAVVPGRFQQTGDSKAVIFVHDTQSDNLQKVFLSQRTKDNDGVHLIYAEQGRIQESAFGEQTLVLSAGNQYDGKRNENNYQIVNFDEYTVTITPPNREQEGRKLVAASTAELWKMDTIEASAELQWRIAIPLSLPFLVLIAVPLSAVDPRQGRFGKMFPALLLYLGYFLLLLASRRIMEDGNLPSFLGLWWVHVVMLLVGIGLIARDRKTGVVLRQMFLRQKHV